MAFRRPRFDVLVTCLLCSGLISLAGCGGGGGKDPASNDQGQAIVQSDGGPFDVAVDTSTTPSHFQAVGLPGVSPGSAKSLAIIDTNTKKIVKTFVYDDLVPASDRYAIDATTGAVQRLGAGYVYMIQGGKVMQLDLSGATLGDPKQISSITNACYISGGGGWDLAADGKHQWLSILVPGAGSTCDKISSYQNYYVYSNMVATKAGVLRYGKYQPTGINIEAVLTDKQGLSQGLLVMDMGTRRLYVTSNDLQRELYNVKDNFLAPSEQMQILSPMPAQQKGLLMAGARLYVANWSSGKLVLGDVAITLATGIPWNVKAVKDKTSAYVTDGTKLYAISDTTDKVTILASINTALGSIFDIYDTTDALVIYQQNSVGSTSSDWSLSAINKASGTSKEIFTRSTDSVNILGTSGTSLLMQRYLSGSTSVELRDVNAATSKTLFNSTNISDMPQVRQTWNGMGNIQISDVLWYHGTGASSTSETTISSYNIATKQTVPVGTLPAYTLDPSSTSSYSIFASPWADEPAVIYWGGQLWQFSPSSQDSLALLSQVK